MADQPTGNNEAQGDIRGQRCYRAPRNQVYRMWTDPQHVVQWWGPDGFTTTIEQMDVRTDGEWRLVLHSPDGQDFKNRSVDREVQPDVRLVYDHISGPVFRMETSFSETADGTDVTARLVFDTAAQREYALRQFNAEEGLRQTLERLAQYLEHVQQQEEAD